MGNLIKGITVTLFERTQTGTDDFGAPVYAETPVTVQNVLVCPVSADAVVNELKLYGKRAVYELCLPKGDDHNWSDCRVDFFDQRFRVFGPAQEYIEAMIPLCWNKKVKVERYE